MILLVKIFITLFSFNARDATFSGIPLLLWWCSNFLVQQMQIDLAKEERQKKMHSIPPRLLIPRFFAKQLNLERAIIHCLSVLFGKCQ